LTINSSRNVGIGTTTPDVRLYVLGGGTAGIATQLTVSSSGNSGLGRGTAILIKGPLTASEQDLVKLDAVIDAALSGAFAVQTVLSGTMSEKFRITSGGNVGIGTTTPTTNLQVTTSSSNATSTLTVGKANQTKGSCLELFDAVGTPHYLSVVSGSLQLDTNSCK